jgi:hypothetical protein
MDCRRNGIKNQNRLKVVSSALLFCAPVQKLYRGCLEERARSEWIYFSVFGVFLA